MKKTLVLMMTSMMALAACQNRDAVPGIDLTDLDETVSPKEDFYLYATGGWKAKNPLKPEYARYGAFDILGENNETRLNSLFETMANKSYPAGSVERKISDLYKMGLDTLRRNNEKAEPLKPYIAEIQNISDINGLVVEIARAHKGSDSPFFGIYVTSDMVDNSKQILYLCQSGLGMGDRDYYAESADKSLKDGYHDFLVKILTLSGIENAEAVAADALAVENSLAEASWTSVECRDTQKAYNPMSMEDILANYPNLHLDLYFKTLGVVPEEKTVLEQPSFFSALDKMFAEESLGKLKNYLLCQTISGACGTLSSDFYNASFDFFSRQMAGIKQQKPLWKRAMAVPNSLLSEAVGKMYVDKYFSAKDKERMTEMVGNIQKALGEHIDSLDWMSDATKAKAHEKLSSFTVKIGYPDKWKDYTTLDIDPSLSYYQNIRNAGEWYTADNLSKLGKPIDKSEWLMSPQTVNAYYNPTTNEICFPAAILQPPFYNPNADDAVNYGAIGVVISHEMTHGFDDQGRHFDKDGNMNDWWTPEDAETFAKKTAVLVKQFDEVEVLPGVHANGALSLGENIADHGGLRISYTALQNSFKGHHPSPIDGFTAEQRFYLAYAKVWADNITDEEIARRTKLDVHSLGRNRVNVTLRNLDTFFEAFGIAEGDKMFRPESERVVIW